MRREWLFGSIILLSLISAGDLGAYGRQAVPAEESGIPYGLSADCVLQGYNSCACWMWVFSGFPRSVWGSVLDPDDCPAGCPGGGKVTDVWFWSNCDAGPAFEIGGVGLHAVDAVGCLTGLLWQSGTFTVRNCVSQNHWTHVSVPADSAVLAGQPVAVTIAWGANPRFHLVADCGIANLLCSMDSCCAFPGCQSPACACPGWRDPLPPQVSYIYSMDLNGDTVSEDLCDLYSVPYPVAFPYWAPYGYLPNNLKITIGLDCSVPTSVEGVGREEASSWGRLKALFE